MRKIGYILLAVVLGFGTLSANADFIENLQYGLGYAGFSQQPQKNYEGDGWNYNIGTTFTDRKFDFGNVDITLNGAVTGQFGYTRRGIPEIEMIFNTPNGLTYDLDAFDGLNKYTVTDGQFFIASDIKLNLFGGYDIQLDISSAGELVSDDPNKAPIPLDFEMGPINIHGQWLVDLINITLGRALGFELPGGGLSQVVDIYQQVANEQAQQVLAYTAINNDSAVHELLGEQSAVSFSPVPEPMSLLILMIGSLMIRRRK
jgi:hypothetical protein